MIPSWPGSYVMRCNKELYYASGRQLLCFRVELIRKCTKHRNTKFTEHFPLVNLLSGVKSPLLLYEAPRCVAIYMNLANQPHAC